MIRDVEMCIRDRYRTMELIETEIGNLRGTELSGQISDGVLVFTVNYGVFAGETTALLEMTEVSVDTSVNK